MVQLAPGAVQFDVLSGYNPLPEKPAKDASKTKDADGAADSDSPAAGVKKKGPKSPKSALPKGGVKAQKGAPR